MKQHRALNAVLATQWAITEEYLDIIAAIAEREHEYAGNLQALEAKLGRPLGNTMTASVRDGVAMIPVEGPMFKRANFFQAISGATDYATIARDLTEAIDDPAVNSIILMIDSPGGEVTGVAELAAMIRASAKPVWAFIEGSGCSAAYWLAAACHQVIASPTAVVGSIGCQIGFSLKEPKAGEKSYRFVSSVSPLKNAHPDTEAGAAGIQAIADDLGTVFVNSMAEYRKVMPATVLEKFGQGGTMVAAKALAAGMIDSVSTYEDALISLKQETMSMDYSTLTAQALADNRPDLVAEFRAQGVASVEKVDAAAVRAEAVKAERERIVAIEALAVPGAEAIIATAKADGSAPTDVAVKLIQHVQAGGTKDPNKTALDNIRGAESGMKPPKATGEAGEHGRPDTDELDGLLNAARTAGAIR